MTIEAAINAKAIKSRDLKRVTMDTTVKEKAIRVSNRFQTLQQRPRAPGATVSDTRKRRQVAMIRTVGNA